MAAVPYAILGIGGFALYRMCRKKPTDGNPCAYGSGTSLNSNGSDTSITRPAVR